MTLPAEDPQVEAGRKPPAGEAAPEQLLAPPANDTCAGAIVVPAGPYPVLSAVTTMVDMATDDTDVSLGNPCWPLPAVRGVWYRWTPTASGLYDITAFPGQTATTDRQGYLSVYASAACAAGSFVEVGCNYGGPEAGMFNVPVTALTTYYILASTTTGGGMITQFQLRIDQSADTCALARPVMLDMPVVGSTAGATNDYLSPAVAGCYSGLGQTQTTAPGRDVVYAFTAPAAGSYSFRVRDYTGSPSDLALYVANNCPISPPAPPLKVGCLGAANRTAADISQSEEVMCLSLGAGMQVWIYVDETSDAGGSGNFTLEVNRCLRETEANNTPGAANALACGIEGSSSAGGVLGDPDFFALGAPPANSRAFALVDGGAAGSSDFDLRVTTATNTLEYDNDNNDVGFGDLAPNIGGRLLPFAPSFLRLNQLSAAAAEPYRLYSVVQGPIAAATPETEPNGGVATANSATNNYFSGASSSSSDLDAFKFFACKGDLILLSLDEDPLRNETPYLADLELFPGIGGYPLEGSLDTGGTSSSVLPPASLTNTSPFSPAKAFVYRARYGGPYIAVVVPDGAALGDYLLSISLNCAAGSPAADLSVTKTDSPDPVSPDSNITYAVSVTNGGPDSSGDVALSEATPASTTFVSIAAPPDWICTTPVVGGTGTIICTKDLLPPGIYPFTIVVKVDPGTPGGTVVTNTATVSSTTTCRPDPNAANDAATATTTVVALPPAAGRVPAGAPAQPLRVTKALGSDITLTWDPSCIGTDNDYGIYEGTIGAYYSHVSKFCTTGGATSKTFTPLAGRQYYLVVPLNGAREGSYGPRSDLSERPAGTSPCYPQALAACP